MPPRIADTLATSDTKRRDTAAVVEHTTRQFTDGARRLTERLQSSGIWD